MSVCTCFRPRPAPCCTAGQGACSWGAYHWCRRRGNRLWGEAPLRHHTLNDKRVFYWHWQQRTKLSQCYRSSTNLILPAGAAAGFLSTKSGWVYPTCEQSLEPFQPGGSCQTWDQPGPVQEHFWMNTEIESYFGKSICSFIHQFVSRGANKHTGIADEPIMYNLWNIMVWLVTLVSKQKLEISTCKTSQYLTVDWEQIRTNKPIKLCPGSPWIESWQNW